VTAATLRIGCGSGFWGDSPEGARQLVEAGVDVLVFDYLAEITMALLAQARTRDPEAGFVPDFIDYVIRPHAKAITAQNIKLVANAGGVNPLGCKAAVEKALAAAGVERTVAVVTGDDLLAEADALRAAGCDLPPHLVSLNAYLGARPIAAALAAGADIVITGRCVDSALVLGPLVHAFGWDWSDYDRLSQGSLAGHIVECGCQATGGILTDWEGDAWDSTGYPIVECAADGSFTVTKPENTGGRVGLASVGEQIVYEVGDPAAYALPDVICDWRDIHLAEVGRNRVRVSGARGRAPSGLLKLSAVATDGFRASGELTIGGREVAHKARKTGEAILIRTRRMMTVAGFDDYAETRIEVLGAGALYGPYVATPEIREILLRVSVRHPDRKALSFFSQEFLASATSMAQGITGISAGRPRARPLLRHKAVFLDADQVGASVSVGEQRFDIASGKVPARIEDPAPFAPIAATRIFGERCIAPLIAYAFGRSGDKGDIANIGIIARRADYLPILAEAVSESAVAQWFAHLVKGPVHRYDWPGLPGFNFVMESALGGGGTASLRIDPQGKTYAQILMDFPVPGPAAWFAPGGPLAAWRDA
jgi:hypothetical protein